MTISAQHITKRFGKFTALDDVSVEAPSGKLTALLGPSGSGKTTLLRIIAGLEFADSGQVLFDGVDASQRNVRERNVGFVFQHYALFKHMTIFENVAFGLRVRKRPKDEINTRVYELLKLVQLEGLEKRYPHQLSGGQRQRIALARALAAEPKVLLLDEPFGALDAKVRKELRRWLRKLHDEIHVTSLFVTHDQEEALEVSDQVVIFSKGKVEQAGTPDDVYNKPANPFVLSFLGHVNVFHGRDNGVGPGESQAAYVRPHEIDLVREKPQEDGAAGTVVWVHRAGATIKVEVGTTSGELLMVELPRERYATLALEPGDNVWAVAREKRVFTGDYQI